MNPPDIASDTLVEAIARAIAEGQGDDFDHAHRDKPHWIETRGESGGRYRDINEPRQPDYIDAARAALTAIAEAGFVVCPIEPTEAMEEAARDVPFIAMGNGEYLEPDRIDIYRAMIAAAQAIEARSGETEGLDPQGESAVSAGNAPYIMPPPMRDAGPLESEEGE